jgi:hypothetical protein
LCAWHRRLQIFVRDCGGTGVCYDNTRAGACFCAMHEQVDSFSLAYAKVWLCLFRTRALSLSLPPSLPLSLDCCRGMKGSVTCRREVLKASADIIISGGCPSRPPGKNDIIVRNLDRVHRDADSLRVLLGMALHPASGKSA